MPYSIDVERKGSSRLAEAKTGCPATSENLKSGPCVNRVGNRKQRENHMAHNIERRNGKDSIVFAGATPWHRLGKQINEAFDAATALKEGGLDFTVSKVGLQTVDGFKLENRYALRRDDTKDVLGVVTDFYKPLQNTEAFSFFDGVFGKGKARYEVAGVLGKGERVWLLAKLPGDFEVAGRDVVGKWLLLTNGHDGNEPIRAKFTPIRVVCQNTLNAALRGTDSEVRVQHIGNVPGKLELAGKLMKQAGVYFDDIQAVFSGFAKRSLKSAGLREYAARVVTGEAAAPKWDDLSGPARGSIEKIEELHETGRGHDIKGVRGTLWGAYNAVTEWVDHTKTTDDLKYLAIGRGGELKQRAFEVAQELAVSSN